jgi:hypothetical protein
VGGALELCGACGASVSGSWFWWYVGKFGHALLHAWEINIRFAKFQVG